MSAFHVVVRPRPEHAPSPALVPLYGLIDVVVDGINITARIGDGLALTLLVDLAHAVSALATGREERAALQLYAEEDVWELGIEASGDDTLLSVYRSGPSPDVAVYERKVALSALHQGVRLALDDAPVAPSTPRSIQTQLKNARRLLESCWPPRPRSPRIVESLRAASCDATTFQLAGEADFRHALPARHRKEPDPQVERADLHSLLVRGSLSVRAHGKQVLVSEAHLFLLAERFVALASEVLDAWQGGRPTFRRVEVGGIRVGVRRGPGDVPAEVSVSGPSLRMSSEPVVFPAIGAADFARAATSFALELAQTFVECDPAQKRNLRLTNLTLEARAVQERLDELTCDDSLTNPSPDEYRRFAPNARTARAATGIWSQGGKMRFAPKWVATVPDIDLRATFLCGTRIVIGAAGETACMDRSSGAILWRLRTPRGGSVVTPAGLARLAPDGLITMHDLETGHPRFRVRVAPRTAGGATGAVVYSSGLPKLLVVAEGDRRITAIDLISGDIRWRHTARRSGDYRIRRAGKLLLVTGGDSSLVALDVSTGEVVWRLRDRLPFLSNLTLDHDAGFALSGTSAASWKLHQIDPWSGRLRFTIPLEDRPLEGQPPIVTPEVVIVATRDREGVGARAFDRHNGTPLWEHAPGLASPTTSWLAVDDSVVVNTDAGVLLCLEARTGRVRYNHVFARNAEADQPRRLEPVLRSGALFVPQHEVHVVRPGDGEVIGHVPADLIPDLLRVDECCNVYIAEESGHVAAFGVAPRLALVKDS